MAVADALGRLYALAPRGMRRGLEPMRVACEAEGDPQEAAPVVHVGGTNGKGSVCASLDAIARAAGLRVGLYTSPHLGRFAERIRINGAPIDDGTLEVALARAMDRHPELTFFEIATLAAFGIFRDASLDLIVLEVGLGGRLDATNVVTRPRATAITSIGLDHTEILGDSLEAIAFEKAGILKAGAPLILGRVPEVAAAVIEARALAVSAGPIQRVGRELSATRSREARDASSGVADRSDARRLLVRGPHGRAVDVAPALAGAHQDDNATVATALAWLLAAPRDDALGHPAAMPIDDAHIARGLADVRWPGRLEDVAIDEGELAGRYLLDGAHNEEGARALAAALDARADSHGTRRALVFGVMAEKAWSAMLQQLVPRFDARVYVEPTASGGGRAATRPESLIAFDPGARAAPTLRAAVVAARAEVGRAGLVVIAGSLYLVGEARSLLLSAPSDPHVGL